MPSLEVRVVTYWGWFQGYYDFARMRNERKIFSKLKKALRTVSGGTRAIV